MKHITTIEIDEQEVDVAIHYDMVDGLPEISDIITLDGRPLDIDPSNELYRECAEAYAYEMSDDGGRICENGI